MTSPRVVKIDKSSNRTKNNIYTSALLILCIGYLITHDLEECAGLEWATLPDKDSNRIDSEKAIYWKPVFNYESMSNLHNELDGEKYNLIKSNSDNLIKSKYKDYNPVIAITKILTSHVNQ